jgi:hypothetical protein
MTSLTTEDWSKMQELVYDVVDQRITRSEARAESKFATKEEMNKRFDQVMDRLDVLIVNDQDNRTRIARLERKVLPASN